VNIVSVPGRRIPRAHAEAVAFIAVFYTIATWLVSVGAGVTNVQSAAAADPGGFIFTLADQAVGPAFRRILEILVITSFLALFIGFQNLLARYVFALGRAGAAGRSWARTPRDDGSRFASEPTEPNA
jgi:amino acid transporter